MKLLLLFILFMASLVIAKDPVKVSLLIEAEEDEGKDFLEISLFITKQDESLTKALVQSDKLVKEIEKHVKNYCEQDSKNKKCGDAFEVQDPEVDTKYQIVRKQSTFQYFIVKRQITIKVYKIETLGPLVDQLQKLGVSKFEEFAWKGEDQQQEEQIVIENAIERLSNLCESFDYKFERITEVTQIQPQQQDDKQQDGDDDEEDDEPNVYQVIGQCVATAKAAKK